ncbi:unnamed protein product [Caenorhabditis angaria]|uniref:Uncharacterized protein n=1 Tax=Caenorhabditis angaria TaxID=860376 RepID=A0A9P1IRJ6_9PELO|nr:unnamed protein product [Caenorhabditis angaria]
MAKCDIFSKEVKNYDAFNFLRPEHIHYPENDKILRNCASYETCTNRRWCIQELVEVIEVRQNCKKFQFFNDMKPCLEKISSCFNQVKEFRRKSMGTCEETVYYEKGS